MAQDRGEILRRIKIRLERALPIVRMARLESLESRLLAVIDETEDQLAREDGDRFRTDGKSLPR
jgi:hypothetical protein